MSTPSPDPADDDIRVGVSAGLLVRRTELGAGYARRFMTSLARRATPSRHASVLERRLRLFKERLAEDEHEHEHVGSIADLRAGLVRLVVPPTLVHHLRVHDVPYRRRQRYRDSHPHELALRNHA